MRVHYFADRAKKNAKKLKPTAKAHVTPATHFMDCATEQDVFMRTNMNPLGAPTCGITVFGSALTGIAGTFMWVFEDIRGSSRRLCRLS